MIDQLSVNAIRTGPRDAETVVLLHAVGYDLTYWDRQIDALRQAYDVVAFDLPGHGRSPGSAADWTFANAVSVIANVIRSTGTRPVHLVGISFGGMLAQTTALAHPELLRSLTLIATAPSFAAPVRDGMRDRAETVRRHGMQAVLSSSLERWFTKRTMSERPDLIDRVTKTVLGDDPLVHAAVWDLIANEFDVTERLAEIRCPTLVLVGDRDPSTPPATARTLAERIDGASLVVLPETSHMANLESAAAVNAELLRFLR